MPDLDFEFLTNSVLSFLDNLTEEQQAAALKGLGLLIGGAAKSSKTKIDDNLLKNVGTPGMRTLADAIDEALSNGVAPVA